MDYENGLDTRKKILAAAQRLFYEKGFHETSFQDIYRQAHVSRGTVYYHFKSKDDMRYEVLWEFTMSPKHTVEKYCDQTQYHYLLTLCITWILITKDEKYRKFIQDYCNDCLVYSNRMDLSLYHSTIYHVVWGQFWDRDRISDLSFASVYGYIIGCCLMICREPEKYDPVDLFIHCNNACLTLWGIPLDRMGEVWNNFRTYLSGIPESELQVKFMDE